MRTVDCLRLRIPPGGRILDIGCGSGRHCAAALEIPGVCVIGIDTCQADLCQAADRLRLHEEWGMNAGGNWRLLRADALHLPFDAGVFDAVICSEVLEHVPKDRAALQEIRRVLKPGGMLAVSVPRYFPERICWKLSSDYRMTPGGHIRIYRKQELLRRLVHAGFMVREHRYAHSLHTPYWWLKCLVGPGRTDSMAVGLYHRFLTWDMMRQPFFSRFLDRLLNPVLGKSLVLYAVCSGPGSPADNEASFRITRSTVPAVGH